jgi:AraC family transcriptional regulator
MRWERLDTSCDGMQLSRHALHHPKLVLWRADGPALSVRDGGRWTRWRPQHGSLDLWPAGEVDTVRVGPGRLDALVIHFQGGAVELLVSDPRVDPQVSDPRLARIVQRIDDLLGGVHSTGPLDATHLTQALVARLAERREGRHAEHDQSHGLPPSTRAVVAGFIDDALGSPLTIHTLANLVGYRPSPFTRAFRVSFGVPPHQYLLHRRIERACDWLRATDRSLVEIAQDLAFSSQAHFTSAFRSVTGYPPGRYRMEQNRHEGFREAR